MKNVSSDFYIPKVCMKQLKNSEVECSECKSPDSVMYERTVQTLHCRLLCTESIITHGSF